MRLYTIYPCKADGGSELFLTLELADDAEAYVRALRVLEEQHSATHVVVWCGDRKVLTRERVHPDLSAVLRTSPSQSEDAP